MGNQCSHLSLSLSSPQAMLRPASQPASKPASEPAQSVTLNAHTRTHTHTHTHTHTRNYVLSSVREAKRQSGGSCKPSGKLRGFTAGTMHPRKNELFRVPVEKFLALLLYAQQHYQGQQLGRGLTSSLAPFEDNLIEANQNEHLSSLPLSLSPLPKKQKCEPKRILFWTARFVQRDAVGD